MNQLPDNVWAAGELLAWYFASRPELQKEFSALGVVKDYLVRTPSPERLQEIEVAVARAVEFAEYVEGAAKGKIVERAKHFLSLPYSQELARRLADAARFAWLLEHVWIEDDEWTFQTRSMGGLLTLRKSIDAAMLAAAAREG